MGQQVAVALRVLGEGIHAGHIVAEQLLQLFLADFADVEEPAGAVGFAVFGFGSLHGGLLGDGEQGAGIGTGEGVGDQQIGLVGGDGEGQTVDAEDLIVLHAVALRLGDGLVPS